MPNLPPGTGKKTSPALSGDSLVAEARKYIGKLYVYGDEGPNTFDCSGLIQYSLARLGYGGFPRVAIDQIHAGTTPIKKSDLQPGDLIGFHRDLTHIAIYSGNGKMIEAPQTWISPGVRGRVREVPVRWADATAFGRIKKLQPGLGAAGPGGGGGGFSIPGLPDFGALVKPFTELADAFESFGKIMSALLLPSTWVRIAAGWFGMLFIVWGIIFLVLGAQRG